MESWRKPAVADSMSTRTGRAAGPEGGGIAVGVVAGCDEQARQASMEPTSQPEPRLH